MTSPPREPIAIDDESAASLARDIKRWGRELGFGAVAICDASPRDSEAVAVAAETEARLARWIADGHHGEMDYMARHGMRRARPAELVPGTRSVVVVRMDYLPAGAAAAGRSLADARGARATDAGSDAATGSNDAGAAGIATDDASDDAGDDATDRWIAASWVALGEPRRANVSRYAHGRDYHKVMRARLARLAARIDAAVGPFGHRVFTDSAPVMEVELARRAGLGWRGKHTLLLSRDAGSMFFLGELFVDLALPPDPPVADHCGTCTRCIDVCPTRAIVAPGVLDARLCISYLTIEHPGPIPEALRPAIGNRIYGCDDCQLVCPWNRFAQRSPLPDFEPRTIADRTLVEAFAWDEAEFQRRSEGSAIRRIGHVRWSRNVAVALGNALASGQLDAEERAAVRAALAARRDDPSPLVREHVAWALARGADDAMQVTAPPRSTAAA